MVNPFSKLYRSCWTFHQNYPKSVDLLKAARLTLHLLCLLALRKHLVQLTFVCERRLRRGRHRCLLSSWSGRTSGLQARDFKCLEVCVWSHARAINGQVGRKVLWWKVVESDWIVGAYSNHLQHASCEGSWHILYNLNLIDLMLTFGWVLCHWGSFMIQLIPMRSQSATIVAKLNTSIKMHE